MADVAKTQEQASLEIIKRIQEKTFDPRELEPKQRRVLVAVLRHDYSEAQIALILKVSDRTIARDVKAIKTQGAKLVKDITVETIVGELVRKAEVLYSKAVKAGNLSLAWTIAGGLVTKLQSLGVVFHKTTEAGPNIHIGDKHETTTIVEVGQLTKDMSEKELRGIDDICRRSLNRANPPQPSPVEHGMPNN